ncbi:hypothetical protein CsSME_00049359 [Camellia sinensis var. sinensis]|uniref:Uncharacterized protein n=1 Tax=Camellia sinensis var. sinensis TaxID=542762 RepID=A0A4V3WQ98_CAMSN|nr:hypothetical protein TEA_002363 [Camellia sinensis var. sinensis]
MSTTLPLSSMSLLSAILYLNSLILLCKLMTKVDLLPPSVKDLQFNRFFKNGFLLLARVIAVTFCVTLATSLAARLGATPMAAFQICLQVWITSSLLFDGLAIAGQVIIACAFAEKDYEKAKVVATRVLQMGFGSEARCSCWTPFAIWIWNIYKGQKCCSPH